MKTGSQSGPDMTNGYEGILAGSLNTNILDLIYSYTVEGSKNKEQEIYELQDNSLVKLRWTLVEKNNMLVPDKIGEPKSILYLSEKCN